MTAEHGRLDCKRTSVSHANSSPHQLPQPHLFTATSNPPFPPSPINFPLSYSFHIRIFIYDRELRSAILDCLSFSSLSPVQLPALDTPPPAGDWVTDVLYVHTACASEQVAFSGRKTRRNWDFGNCFRLQSCFHFFPFPPPPLSTLQHLNSPGP